MKKIENANIIIQNGLELENFMDKILGTYSKIKIIDSSSNITNKIEENGEVNAHIWTSISNYMVQVEEIAKGLIETNPENSDIYRKNKETYITKLQELQAKYNTELVNIKGKKVICLNEALTYLAKEVELEVTSVETDHEESSISAEKMKDLINEIKQDNITAIFIGDEDNIKSAETISKETGAKIYRLKSGLTGSGDVGDYIKMMEENLEQLKQI